MSTERLRAEILKLLGTYGSVPTYVLRNYLANTEHLGVTAVRRALKTARVLRICQKLEDEGAIVQDGSSSGSYCWKLP